MIRIRAIEKRTSTYCTPATLYPPPLLVTANLRHNGIYKSLVLV